VEVLFTFSMRHFTFCLFVLLSRNASSSHQSPPFENQHRRRRRVKSINMRGNENARFNKKNGYFSHSYFHCSTGSLRRRPGPGRNHVLVHRQRRFPRKVPRPSVSVDRGRKGGAARVHQVSSLGRTQSKSRRECHDLRFCCRPSTSDPPKKSKPGSSSLTTRRPRPQAAISPIRSGAKRPRPAATTPAPAAKTFTATTPVPPNAALLNTPEPPTTPDPGSGKL
jgi:hypothetical protein